MNGSFDEILNVHARNKAAGKKIIENFAGCESGWLPVILSIQISGLFFHLYFFSTSKYTHLG